MSIFAPAKRINYISTNLKIMYLDAAKNKKSLKSTESLTLILAQLKRR